MSEPIRDPFDATQAIMPSGRLGVPVVVAPPGTPIDSDSWRQVGWSDGGTFAPLHTTPKEGND